MKKIMQILAFIGTVLHFFMTLLDTMIINIAVPYLLEK